MSLCVEPSAIYLPNSSDVFLFLMATQVSHRITEVWAMSALEKLVLACHREQKADLYMPCDGLLLQLSAVFTTLGGETSLWRSDQGNLNFLSPLLCDLIQGPH